jgi:hypothetical protein
MMVDPQTTDDQYTIERNVISLSPTRLPSDYIDKDTRGDYLLRAMKGEDVYAYGSETTGYYVWDTDTRIILPKLDQVKWTLTGYSFVVGYTWSITVRQESTGILNSFEISMPTCKNADHAERLVKVLIGHANKWDADPLGYNGCVFNG